MALTQIDAYPKPHGSGDGNGGKTIIKGSRGTSTYGSVNVTNINASKGNINYLTSKSITANDAEIMYLMTKEGTILKLSGTELMYKSGYIGDLSSDSIATKKLTAEDIEAVNAYIKTLQSYEITTDYLTVTKQAHFFELVIDKIRSVGGIVIITPASCEIDYVRGHTYSGAWVTPNESNYDNIDYFQVFWRAENEGKNVSNDFVVNDQAICQSLGNIHEGTNSDVANKYYWRLVKSVGYDQDHHQVYVNLSTGEISTNPSYTTDNNFQIIMYDTQSKDVNGEYYYNNIAWEAKPQQFLDSEGNIIGGIDTNTDWINNNKSSGEAINGTFKTHSQQYGMYIKPRDNSNDLPVTNKLRFSIKQTVSGRYIIPDRINIGVYFKDDSYKCWQDAQIDENGILDLDLDDPNTAIEMIIIVSTADVNWHLCNCMTISNVYTAKSENELTTPAAVSECDYTLSKKASIPARGDNLVQLGYRASGSSDTNKNRQSAIIIAAYQSPDSEITPPSYAQYMGIDDFDLSSHRKTYFDANNAEFIGTLTVRSGNTETSIDNYIKGKIAEVDLSKMWKNSRIESPIGMIVIRKTGNTIAYEPQSVPMFSIYYDSTGTVHGSNAVPQGYKVRLGATDRWGVERWIATYNAGTSLSFSTSTLFDTIITVAENQYDDDLEITDIKNITFELWRLASVADGINEDTLVNQHQIYVPLVNDGVDGEDGETTEIYKLNPFKEILTAGLISAIQNSPTQGQLGPVPLVYDLAYSVYKNVGSVIQSETDDIANGNTFYMRLEFYNKSGSVMFLYKDSTHGYTRLSVPVTYVDMNPNYTPGEMNQSYYGFQFHQNAQAADSAGDSVSLSSANLLDIINPSFKFADNDYRDYMKCYTNHPERCPAYVTIQLWRQGRIVDTRIVYIQLETGAVFRVLDDKIVSAIADSQTGQLDLSGYVTKTWLTNNYNALYSDAYKTTFKMNGDTYVLYTKEGVDQQILYALNGGSEIEITSQMIRDAVGEIYTKSEVDELFADINDDPNYYKREIDLYTDTSIYNNDYYYPILVYGDGLGNDYPKLDSDKNGPMIRCQVDCGLDEFTYSSSSRPSWGGLYPQDSHNRGVALVCNWSAFCNAHGEWNSREKNVYINAYELKYTRKSGGSNYDEDNTTNNIKVIGGPSDTSGIVQNNGYMIFYLRGGAKYNFRFDWPNIRVKAFPTGIPTSIISNGGSQYGVIAQADSQALYVPQLDRMWRSEILRQADRIALNVWSETAQGELRQSGIDITSRKINLSSENTNVNGTLNLYNNSGTGGEGFKVWNGTQANATKSVQISDKELGQVQNYVMTNVGNNNTTSMNVMGLDGLACTPNYNQMMWWGKSDGDDKYEFIVRDKLANFRIRDNGIYRTQTVTISTGMTDPFNGVQSAGKQILNSSIDQERKWSDLSTTTPVYIWYDDELDVTTDGGSGAGEYPNANFRRCGIYAYNGGKTDGELKIYLPNCQYCAGRMILFKNLTNSNTSFTFTTHNDNSWIMNSTSSSSAKSQTITTHATLMIFSVYFNWVIFKSA